MEWCLDCHRAPEKHVRPRDKVFDLAWTWESEGKDPAVEAPKLIEKYKIATWKYPVHNRAQAGAAHAANPHDPHAKPVAAGGQPPSIANTDSNGVVKQLGKPSEFSPNPLTNCSVCHY
jgi:hypothetical protein